jgi:hypothetical protein
MQADPHTDAHCDEDPHADAHPEPHSHPNSDAVSHGDEDPHILPDGHPNPNPYPNGHEDPHAGWGVCLAPFGPGGMVDAERNGGRYRQQSDLTSDSRAWP